MFSLKKFLLRYSSILFIILQLIIFALCIELGGWWVVAYILVNIIWGVWWVYDHYDMIKPSTDYIAYTIYNGRKKKNK